MPVRPPLRTAARHMYRPFRPRAAHTTTTVVPCVGRVNARARGRKEEGQQDRMRVQLTGQLRVRMYELSMFSLLPKQQCGRAMHGEGKKPTCFASFENQQNKNAENSIGGEREKNSERPSADGVAGVFARRTARDINVRSCFFLSR